MAVGLPPGFVLDKPNAGLPPGFVLDTPKQDSFGDDALDVAGEAAAGANRTLMFIPDTAIDAVNKVVGGLGGLAELATGGDLESAVQRTRATPIPTPSEAVEDLSGHRPGQGGFMEPGTARNAVAAAGEVFIPGGLGLKAVQGRNLAKPAEAAAEFLGAGRATPFPNQALAEEFASRGKKVLPAEDPLDKFARFDEPGRDIAVRGGRGDVAAAGFRLDDAGRSIPDPVQRKALSVGVDEGRVAQIAAADLNTRKSMRDMLDITKQGVKNARFRDIHRPGKVVGQALDARLKVVRNVNLAAGRRIDKEAGKLKGHPLDIQSAMSKLQKDMKHVGIKFDAVTGELNFSEANIEGVTAVEDMVSRIINRLHNTKSPTAFDVHRAKRFLDTQLTYGAADRGLDGQTKAIFKRLRHNLDGLLDERFPAYDKANTTYAETIGILDEVQSLVGKRVDLLGDNSDDALGIMSRKILTNYANAVPMRNLMDNLSNTAIKYGRNAKDNPLLNNDVVGLAGFDAELRRLFPTASAANTFQGIIGTEAGRTARNVATGDHIGLVGQALDKLKPSEKKIIQQRLAALRELLADEP